MHGVSLQIQTVVFKMDIESLLRSLTSVQNAIRVDREGAQTLSEVHVVYGDTSPERVLGDQDVQAIRERYQDWFTFEYCFFNENSGTARSHNRLGEHCTADYMMVMNPDIQLSPQFFEMTLNEFDRTDVKVGLVEARQVPIEHPKEYDPQTRETSWAATACTVFPTEVFREIGGFDADTFFLYCDDVDFSWRIRLTGRSIIYQPCAPVFHPKYLSGHGRWQPTVAEEFYSAEASLLMAYKWSYDARWRQVLKRLQASNDPVLERAAQSFLDRQAEGRLPEQIDPQHTVGDISAKGYGSSRFAL